MTHCPHSETTERDGALYCRRCKVYLSDTGTDEDHEDAERRAGRLER